MYSNNRFDCLQYILDQIHLQIKRPALPERWFYEKNYLIEGTAKMASEPTLPLKIKAIILSITKLQPGDILFLKYQGKFIHHLAKYIGNGHIEHCMPLRGICRDLLHKKVFVFGVRLWH